MATYSGKPLRKSESTNSLGSNTDDNIYLLGPNSIRLKANIRLQKMATLR